MTCKVCNKPASKLFIASMEDDTKETLKWNHEIKICGSCKGRIIQYVEWINEMSNFY